MIEEGGEIGNHFMGKPIHAYKLYNIHKLEKTQLCDISFPKRRYSNVT